MMTSLKPQKITILGSTGSVGESTLNVIDQHKARYDIFAMTANTNVDLMFSQCKKYSPEYAVMMDPDAASELEARLSGSGIACKVLCRTDGLEYVACAEEVDVVMASIVGAAGLLPTLAAAESGKKLLLANKEALVMTGDLLLQKARQGGATLLPIDSEHNAIFQCLPEKEEGLSFFDKGVSRVLLTASGGPFRTSSVEELKNVTPDQACDHPNWHMGRKISVDCATMMNKGLEMIEACYLFGLQPQDIQIVIHPQSVIHSMVEYVDGSVLAQLGSPDMRTPIAYGLAWPERISSGVEKLDLFEVATLDFEKPDFNRFPCLKLAYDAMERGAAATIGLNAANEVAVAAFLQEKVAFKRIHEVVEESLGRMPDSEIDSVASVLAADKLARELANETLFSGEKR